MYRLHPILLIIFILLLTILWTATAMAAPFAYITNSSKKVKVLDAATDTVVATIDLPFGNATGVAVNKAGTRVYVTHKRDNGKVSVIDTATNLVIATIDVGSQPDGVAVNDAGTRVYVANNGGQKVSVIDAGANVQLFKVDMGSRPWGVAVNPAGTRVYVTTDANVKLIDTATNAVSRVNGTYGGIGVVVNRAGTRVYATEFTGGWVWVIDATTNTKIASVSVGSWPWGLAINPSGTRVYVPARDSYTGVGKVWVIDTSTNSVATKVTFPNSFSTGLSTASVTPDGAKLYATFNASTNTNKRFGVMNAVTNTFSNYVTVATNPFAFGQFTQPASCVPAECNDGNVCTSDTCNPTVGCQFPPVANGTSCSDGNVCNGNETCQGGACSAGTPLTCNDANVCTADSCNPASGCSYPPVTNGTSCSNGDVCDGPETCQGGSCAGGTPLNCNDGNVCTADSCNSSSGCQNPPVANGTSCADGDLCDGSETCQGGTCAAGAPLVCNDGNVCTADSCNSSSGCQNPPVANGTSCADGDVCDGLETCQGGTCTAGAPLNCDDGNVCTADSCNPASGCSFPPVANGTSCSNGDACDGLETCQGGSCAGGTPLDCVDGNVCTDDICDPIAGCQNQPNTAPCDDGDACTTADTCITGQCLGESLCGNGIVDASCGEECDDGGAVPGDGCTAECRIDCDCCAPELNLFSFKTAIGSGACGRLSAFTCSNDPSATCGSDADCNFGACADPPGVCLGNPNATCTGDGTLCTGTCQELLTGTLPVDLECGSLYLGAGMTAVPAPTIFPDQINLLMKVQSCYSDTRVLILGPTTAAETGGMGGCTEAGCIFGPPIPVPVPFDGVCVVNEIFAGAFGVAQCLGGDTILALSLTSRVHLTGDSLPTVPGEQPCPICVRVCQGGASDGLPCDDGTDCDSNVCGGSPACLGGANEGGSCTPSTSDLGGAYPVSRDCPPDPATDITLGGVPIDMVLTSDTGELKATDLPGPDGTRTFCGFCQDASTGCFEGDPDSMCPDSATTNCRPGSGQTAECGTATPCTTGADCAEPYETCTQSSPGAFAEDAATQIAVVGSTDGQCLNDNALHAADLVGIFCVPPTFTTTTDNLYALPGPGALLLQGETRLVSLGACGNGLVEAGEACDDGNTDDGDCCSSSCTFEPSGSPCENGNPCTVGDVCDGAGSCLPGACDIGRACGTACLAALTCQEPAPGECACAAQ